jgi:HD-like signal output (HDOD) protein
MAGIWKRLFTSDGPQARPAVVAAKSGMSASSVALATVLDAPALDGAEIEDRFYRLILGMPDSTTADLRLPEVAMLKRLDKLCGADRFDVASLPRLPAILPQLLRLLKSEQADGIKISRLIGRDPVLVGEVMRVTQSAHFRTLKPIGSLQHAVVLLGHDGLRTMVTLHVMKPILQGSAGMLGHSAGQLLWDHAEQCAHAGMFLAKGQSDPFEAYLAGIVSHAGFGAMIRLLDQEVPPTLGAFSREFLRSCVRMGNYLTLRAALHWELPANVIEALRERMEALGQPPCSGLGKVLLAADHLAMLQLLSLNDRIGRGTPLVKARVDGLPAPHVERARDDLWRRFGSSDGLNR